MLSGSNDGSYLNRFVHDFTDRFAEPNTTILHGAYGHRWQTHFGFNQLTDIIDTLRHNPQDRRCVLTMWDPEDDLAISRRDIPCNTHVYFRIVDHHLDMMVNCRSNDIIWGAYGANAVHMSMMQEYLAEAIGVEIGRYYQNSWNYHAYEAVFDKFYPGINDTTWCAPYEQDTHSLVTYADTFLFECTQFLGLPVEEVPRNFTNKIFLNVAFPMIRAHHLYKNKDFFGALRMCDQIGSGDWRIACSQWIERRAAKDEGLTNRVEQSESGTSKGGEGKTISHREPPTASTDPF